MPMNEALQVALQMLSNGGVRMTPAAAHEQVTDNLARQGLKVQVDIEGCARSGRAGEEYLERRKVWYRV